MTLANLLGKSVLTRFILAAWLVFALGGLALAQTNPTANGSENPEWSVKTYSGPRFGITLLPQLSGSPLPLPMIGQDYSDAVNSFGWRVTAFPLVLVNYLDIFVHYNIPLNETTHLYAGVGAGGIFTIGLNIPPCEVGLACDPITVGWFFYPMVSGQFGVVFKKDENPEYFAEICPLFVFNLDTKTTTTFGLLISFGLRYRM